jgi:general L-amino acid transport system substrate-binding protein
LGNEEPSATEDADFAAVAEDLTLLLRLEPPPELRGFHDAIVQTVSVMLLFLDDTESEESQDDEEDGLLWALLLVLLTRDIEREAQALPEGVRATLEEAGCLWADDFGEALTDSGSGSGGSPATEDTEPDLPEAPPPQDTLGLVLDRGELKCGVKQTQPLFGFKERDGTVTGFDIEFCKAIAAAVLGDPTRVWYIDASDASWRFELLRAGEVDVLIRTTTITAYRDRELGIDYVQPTFYSGEGFAVRRDSGIDSTSDMGDAIICVQTGTITEQNVADHFTDIGLEYDPQGGLSQDVADAFFSGRCDVLTTDASLLASLIAVRADADDYRILPQIISKEPLAPAVREDDSEWRDIVNWVVQGLIRAEEIGITRANVDQMAANPPNAEVARLLGVSYEGGSVSAQGFDRIDARFIQRAIRAVGNYGEIYARTVGDYIPRACTLNDLVINNSGCPDGQGGLMYALPYR